METSSHCQKPQREAAEHNKTEVMIRREKTSDLLHLYQTMSPFVIYRKQKSIKLNQSFVNYFVRDYEVVVNIIIL